jgi:hypothetical protein
MKQNTQAQSLSWNNVEMTISQFFSNHLNETSKARIDTDPIGQRPDIESMSKRQGIINCIMQGYDFGELKLRTLTEEMRQSSTFKYRSVDGGHRKRAIRDFILGKFKTGSYTETIIDGVEYDVSNKYYKDLPEEVKDNFGNYKMRFTVYSENMTDEQAGQQFRTTNICTDVNHQEMLNSYEDNLVAKFIRETCRPIRGLNNKYHDLFEYKSLDPENRKQVWFQQPSKRLRDDEFVTRLLTMIVKLQNNSPTWLTCSNEDMENIFLELGDGKNGRWTKEPAIAKRHQKALSEALNFMMNFAKAKKENSKTLLSNQDFTVASRFYIYLIKTYGRNGFKVKDYERLYWSIRNSMDKFVGNDDSILRMDTHRDSKGIRLVCECFKQYLTVHDDMKRSEQSIAWLLEEMNINDCGILPLDPVRVFSPETIEQAWRQQGGKCYVTGLPLSIKDAVGGHIVAHSDGGRTTIDNCAAIHKDENSRMGSMNVIDYKNSLNDSAMQFQSFQSVLA